MGRGGSGDGASGAPGAAGGGVAAVDVSGGGVSGGGVAAGEPGSAAGGAYDQLEFRRLTAGEGEAERFWESAVDGNRLVVRSGKTGKRGQTQQKTFPDEETARKERDRLETEQLNKGFRIV